MTLPDERYRAVLHTKMFLLELCDTGKTPRIPKEIRQQARWLLRHYPDSYSMDIACTSAPDVFQKNIEDVRRMFMVYEQNKDQDENQSS
jgi:hypothetical protein